MPSNAGLLTGALGGGALGLIGGLISSSEQKRAAKKSRRRQRKAVGQARTFADERVAELTGEGTLFASGVDFLRDTFGDAANSPLAKDFVKQIRAAQAAKGTLFGSAADFNEAGGLSAFSQDLRSRLLPQVQNFAFAPEQLRQNILSHELPIRTSQVTGQPIGAGAAPFIPGLLSSGFNSAISGAFGGAQVGAGFDTRNLQQEQFAELLKQLKNKGPNTSSEVVLDTFTQRFGGSL